jgi:hypothetical protein
MVSLIHAAVILKTQIILAENLLWSQEPVKPFLQNANMGFAKAYFKRGIGGWYTAVSQVKLFS